MGVPLEVSIARLMGDPTHLKEQPEFYPESTAVYVVCPECKREMVEMPYGLWEPRKRQRSNSNSVLFIQPL